MKFLINEPISKYYFRLWMEFTFSCLENWNLGKVVFATLMMWWNFNLTIWLSRSSFMLICLVSPSFLGWKHFPNFWSMRIVICLLKASQPFSSVSSSLVARRGFCSNESCKGRKIKSRPNTRFLMDQTSDFVNRSGSLEMDFRFIQNKDFETQHLFVPWY